VINDGRSISLPWPAFAILASGLLAIGAATAYWWLQAEPGASRAVAAGGASSEQRSALGSSTPMRERAESTTSASPQPDAMIVLSPEVAARAGIEVETTRSATTRGHVRIPGVIEPNAYRQVVVTPLAPGRVTSVSAELGEPVRQGQTLAQIYSPALAEAQSAYLSVLAEFRAADQKLRRTERLADIGAASRQELEQGRAEHMGHAADVESARTRLELLGLSGERVKRLSMAAQITATMDVPAPLSGVVTRRQANPGLVADTATELFTVVDLSTVWAIGSVYDRDLDRVRVGSAVSVTTPGVPGRAWKGHVGYIDPQIATETRTARIRVEVPNRDGRLRLAMYVDLAVEDAAPRSTTLVTRQAVQTVGNRHLVYLPQSGQPGRFIEREVALGRITDSDVEIVSGLSPGDVVVSRGSFLLRAERERLGAARGSTTSAPNVPGPERR
jgi:RND family efflux transporter MFP subunit